jgi:hypothetical protein
LGFSDREMEFIDVFERAGQRSLAYSGTVCELNPAMRAGVSRFLFLTAIAVAMAAWLWMLFEGVEWLVY